MRGKIINDMMEGKSNDYGLEESSDKGECGGIQTN